MRDGSEITCRLQDAGGVISVYMHQDYAPFDLPWDEILSLIDVGAQVGCFTLWALKRAPKAQVVAVEPNPNVFPFLLRNVEANGLARQVATVRAAVGARPGYGAVVDAGFSTDATVVPEFTASAFSVRMITLRQLMEESGLTHCDLLKIDCEGAEYDILNGSAAGVLQRIGTIVCEFHPMPGRSVEELSNRLAAAGFTVVIFGGPLGFLVATRRRG